MSRVKIERIGGLAGFGGEKSRLRSRGEFEMDELSEEDKKAIEDLYTSRRNMKSTQAMDTFRYRISRTTSKGIESIEADEEMIPNAIRQCLRDEII